MKRVLIIAIIVSVIILICGTTFTVFKFFWDRSHQPPKLSSSEQEIKNRNTRKQNLIEIIREIVKKDTPATTLSIGIYDFNHDEYFGYNDTVGQHAAGVSQILTATYVLNLADKGTIGLKDKMGAYDIETQLQFLVNQSSSDSLDLLFKGFNENDQNAFAKEIGLTATDVSIGKNLMSAKDAVTLMKKIEKENLLTESSKTKLYSYMQKTSIERFFSPILDQAKLTYYHKAGSWTGESHDVAYVADAKNPFILAVFTTSSYGSVSPAQMKLIATEVLQYFTEI